MRCVQEVWISHEFLTNKLVAYAPDTEDVFGAGGIIFYLFSDIGDVTVYSSIRNKSVVLSPDLIEKFISGDDLLFSLNEDLEHVEFQRS